MIGAIFFDFDGVLTLNERGSTVTIQAIQESNPDVPAERIRECYYKFTRQLLLGEKDHRSIWKDFCECIGKDADAQVLEYAFSKTPLNEGMIRLASELAPNYRLGIITENALDRMTFLIRKHVLDALFDPIVISARVGKLKDDPGLFEHAVRLVGQKPGDCAFVDNQEKNLTAAEAIGLKTCLFDPKQNDVQRLRSRLSMWGAGF